MPNTPSPPHALPRIHWRLFLAGKLLYFLMGQYE